MPEIVEKGVRRVREGYEKGARRVRGMTLYHSSYLFFMFCFILFREKDVMWQRLQKVENHRKLKAMERWIEDKDVSSFSFFFPEKKEKNGFMCFIKRLRFSRSEVLSF